MHDLTVYIYFYNIALLFLLNFQLGIVTFIRNMIINAGFM